MIYTITYGKNNCTKVVFKNATPKDLYNLYMNEKKHSKATGGPAKITNKEGASFSVHDGYITGENLKIVKNQLIVQSWRGADWDKKDADSTLMIHLEPKGNDVVFHAVHSNVPDNQRTV